MKRFWRDVAARNDDAGWRIALDGRPARTPGGGALTLPSAALAEAVAAEWRGVEATLDPRAMPLTGLANAAIDRVAPDPAGFARGLAVYAESDLLCYRADHPAALVARQVAAWDPLLAWAGRAYGVEFTVATGIVHRPQPPATLARLGAAVALYGPFALAALTPIVTIGGSLVAALALAARAADAEAVWQAVELDHDWQAERWGADELALNARATRRRDFDAGVKMLDLLP